MRRRNYIPTLPMWNDMYVRNFDLPYWTPEAKVPIRKIKVDKGRLAFANPVSRSEVSRIVGNFDIRVWMPILVDKEYYVLDGQHRLAAAKRLGLRYIDVVVEDGELIGGSSHQHATGRGLGKGKARRVSHPWAVVWPAPDSRASTAVAARRRDVATPQVREIPQPSR
jgi:hypothetical protein